MMVDKPAKVPRNEDCHVTRLCLGLLATLGLSAAIGAQDQPAPEKILLGGQIITMAQEGQMAEALALRGDKIVAIGRTADVRLLASSATQIVDLKGKTVL